MVKMEDLVKQVVAYNNIPCYRVGSAMEVHVNANGEQVTVPVIRVVGFFEDTISKITTVLNSEFELYRVNSTGGDPFAASSKIFQAGLREDRVKLPEYDILRPYRFEVHVSSILQDVYSAMYLSLTGDGTPLADHVKRDFNRIGAFLEMADIEFIKIRNKVANSENSPVHETVLDLPMAEREAHVAPAPASRPAEPLPQVVATPATPIQATVAEQIPAAAGDHIAHLESMDMSVDSFDSLGMSIGNIDSKTGASGNDYFDMLTSSAAQKQAQNYDLLSSVKNEPVVEEIKAIEETKPVAEAPTPAVTPVAETPRPEVKEAPETPKPGLAPSEGVALNIDKIDTFNMNVSGMIERTTEIIREVGAGASGAAGATALPVAKKEDEPVDDGSQMTDATLREFVKNSELVRDVDAQIAERAGAKINDDVDIEGDVERLRFLKVFSLKQLQERIADNKDDIVAFAEKWIGKDNGGSFDSGICLFYLEYLLVGKKNDPAFSVEYVLKFISDNDYSARYIIPTYNAIRHAAGEPQSSNFAHLTLK